ncbi:MAG: YHYH protein, partial [Hyphomicrobiales bacterium]|nr:YHYH protein [Hyphomicrobiales bacterium]
MMKGITSWQQQVPLPQDYYGSNSWSIPIKPKIANNPISTADHFHRGAIAVAVNGIPMFNALNNRGEFAANVGELDKWGGHSGRADDYHYHLAPEHLEDFVGKGNPIAYALDGYPVYTQTTDKLDKYLGRFNKTGSYQYHAVDHPPYFIAGLRGEVTTDSPSSAPEDQIIPQART